MALIETAGGAIGGYWETGSVRMASTPAGTVSLCGDGDIASAAFATATAGSAGYTIGKDNAVASGYFGGTLYTYVLMKNAVPSAANRDVVQAYCAGKAKIAVGA